LRPREQLDSALEGNARLIVQLEQLIDVTLKQIQKKELS